ncbi:MAG: phosphoribosylamine--glycine ligase [Cellulomonadaceae bacterium]|nr:phosphoribosylamine--glycine ligase [Cellulomonadaceae bacterium]
MKILVLGSGAREHALVASLATEVDSAAAPRHTIHAAPGNPGMASVATLHPGVDASNPSAVVALAQEQDADIVVVGPEAPLVAGVADALIAANIPVFGPTAAAAQLEGSKAFAKDVMAAAGVPTGRAAVCHTLDEVLAAMEDFGAPHVIKDDGLAAGKGVIVTDSKNEAAGFAYLALKARGYEAAVSEPVAGGAEPTGHLETTGTTGGTATGPAPTVLVEEYLAGPEASVFCISDGTSVVAFSPAQDFKRLRDNDEGPNTGGMGAYTPLAWAPNALADDVVATVAQPVINEMRQRGTPFAGVLYVGLALTADGPKVIEFNVRFGDPEIQAVLARLETPLSEVLMAAASEKLGDLEPLRWSSEAVVNVVIAADHYPLTPRTGDVITGLDAASAVPGVQILHAGTAVGEDAEGAEAIVSAGGRVLSVVAKGEGTASVDSLNTARERAYQAVNLIGLADSQHRTDIALKAFRGEVSVPQK